MHEILSDIEASPTPYHAVNRACSLLVGAGFTLLDLSLPFPSPPGKYVITSGGALIAWVRPEGPPSGYCIVGAHTDSPNLRVRVNAETTSAGWAQIGVEVYGGALYNSWLDRDLGLAGRVMVRREGGIADVLVADREPILRIPQLAIHLDRDVREKGLLLDPQRHLTPLWASSASDGPSLRSRVAALAGIDPDTILAWDLMAFDTQPPAVVGRDRDLFASARIDNQVSCFTGVRALAALDPASVSRTAVLALYDHEEVGSTSSTGAAGGFLGNVLERISSSAGADRSEHLRALAGSVIVSADGAHATHPNYADRHEPSHHIAINGGVVIKRNANQRYATDGASEAWFRSIAADAGLSVQTYLHRNDLPCGSTIGPLSAAELAVPTIDIGAPMLAMHSARETAGLSDLSDLVTTLSACWASAVA
ncbi:MAG: M18 family aminopeptidase [Actinomycetota bacterium]|nr:M18 family aminopeptidase [Actinomycetota bacterium]